MRPVAHWRYRPKLPSNMVLMPFRLLHLFANKSRLGGIQSMVATLQCQYHVFTLTTPNVCTSILSAKTQGKYSQSVSCDCVASLHLLRFIESHDDLVRSIYSRLLQLHFNSFFLSSQPFDHHYVPSQRPHNCRKITTKFLVYPEVLRHKRSKQPTINWPRNTIRT